MEYNGGGGMESNFEKDKEITHFCQINFPVILKSWAMLCAKSEKSIINFIVFM